MISIEAASAASIEALYALHAAAFVRGWTAGEMAAFLADPAVTALAAMAAPDAPVGLAMARQAADQADLLTIAVAPAQRGLGYGHALLSALVTRLAQGGVNALYLEVAEDNREARRLYEAFGCRNVGARSRYYSSANGTDAIVMCCICRN